MSLTLAILCYTLADVLLTVIGVTIDLQFDGSVPHVVQSHISSSWSRCTAPEGSPAALVVTAFLVASESDMSRHMGETRQIVAPNADRLEQQVATYLTLWAIEIQRSSMWLFHAVGLADRQGRTVALAAPSHTGKTTLALAAAKGHGYVTDETCAVLPDSLEVVPYPKPLSVIVRPGEPKRQLGPDELGFCKLPGDLRLVRLGLLSRVPGTREPRVERISLREALFELAPQISDLGGRSQPLRALGDLIAGLGGAVRVVYGEASDLGAVIDSLLRDPSPIDPEWESAFPAGRSPMSDEGGQTIGSDMLRRSPEISDAIWVDDSLVVLSGTRLSHVDGLGVVIWDALEVPVSREELRQMVYERMPPPPPEVDADAFFGKAVAALSRRGIVTIDNPVGSIGQS